MFESIFTHPRALARHRGAPYTEYRENFLRHCSEKGYPESSLQKVAWVLFGFSKSIHLCPSSQISPKEIEYAVDHRDRLYKRSTCSQESRSSRKLFIHVATAWLRFLGYLEEPRYDAKPFADYVERFINFMRDERGLSEATITFRQGQITHFLASIKQQTNSLDLISIQDIDAYLSYQGSHGWTRRSLRTLADALRSFFRFAESQGWTQNIAVGIDIPRVYTHEGLPLGPTWEEVKQLITSCSSDNAIDIRDRAIILLLAVYGLRSGEVTQLCLEDIDWIGEVLHVTRPKQRCTQQYPLDRQVGDALIRYLKDARPQCDHRQLFLTINAPTRPLSPASVTPIVHSRPVALGIQRPPRGAHCLRHACARHLLEAGFSLKQIGDQLGHRSSEATREYVKVDINSLRQVAELNLEKLL